MRGRYGLPENHVKVNARATSCDRHTLSRKLLCKRTPFICTTLGGRNAAKTNVFALPCENKRRLFAQRWALRKPTFSHGLV